MLNANAKGCPRYYTLICFIIFANRYTLFRMEMLVVRSRLIRQVQKQHAKILELSTLLELQRLRTFPTLNLNAINCPDF